MYLKKISKKICLDILKIADGKMAGSGSISQRYGSTDQKIRIRTKILWSRNTALQDTGTAVRIV
jgi:hypothetical protein